MTVRQFVEAFFRERESRSGSSVTGRQLQALKDGTLGGGNPWAQEGRNLRYFMMVKIWASLAPEEQRILELQYLGHAGVETYQRTKAPSEALRDGERIVEPDETVMIGRELVEGIRPIPLTYESIGALVGLSSTQVHRRIKRANAKIRNHPIYLSMGGK